MVLPIVKLATLLFKQFQRPVVKSLSEWAKHHPKFSSGIGRMAQIYHSMDFTVQSKLLGFGKPKKVKSLSEDEARNLGTKLVGETLVYGISASFLLFEYRRSLKNDKIKERRRKDEIAEILRKIHDNEMMTEVKIKELKKQISTLEDKHRSLENTLSTLKFE
ncbi:optic atrophy 3 protein homolog [Mytilus trossulus]|uniref:optic atrophy 3 protein homolog n=1 Tax=Mytilus trossulus TaxID=6551 RepID=UPI0030065B37